MNNKKLNIDCNLEIEHMGRKIYITTPEVDHLEINFIRFSSFRKVALNNYNANTSRNIKVINQALFRNQTLANVKIGNSTILKLGQKKTLSINYPMILLRSLSSVFAQND